MMSTYTSEAEQIEQLKKWWREYGTSLIVGILLALVLSFGWRYWHDKQQQRLELASANYEQLLNNVVNENAIGVQTQAFYIMEHFAHTPYAQLAALQLARQQVYLQDYPAAETQLRWVMQKGSDRALRQIARLRLARLLAAENKSTEALAMLDKIDDKSYLPAIDEVKGDILSSIGKYKDAGQAYQDALKVFPAFGTMQPLLQMKIANLAGLEQNGSSQK